MISFLSHSEQPDPTLGKYCVRSAVSSGLVPGNFGNSILEKTQPSENTRGRLQYLELCSFGLNYSAEIILKVCSLSCFIPIFLDLSTPPLQPLLVFVLHPNSPFTDQILQGNQSTGNLPKRKLCISNRHDAIFV